MHRISEIRCIMRLQCIKKMQLKKLLLIQLLIFYFIENKTFKTKYWTNNSNMDKNTLKYV